jgi:hypothetical protein
LARAELVWLVSDPPQCQPASVCSRCATAGGTITGGEPARRTLRRLARSVRRRRRYFQTIAVLAVLYSDALGCRLAPTTAALPPTAATVQDVKTRPGPKSLGKLCSLHGAKSPMINRDWADEPSPSRP